MTKAEASSLAFGLYRFHWKHGGGFSLASIGIAANGDRWIAPSNWVAPPSHSYPWWRLAERVERIET